MAKLKGVLHQLNKERVRVAKELSRLDAAIRALGGRSGSGTKGLPTRTLSAAARKKIADAQRARWAKAKAGKKG